MVGPSGAGKTTIFQLAERFYDPQAGRVLLDGVDLKDADPADIRQRIAMVPQETVMFAAKRARQSALRQLGRERGAAVAGGARRECRGIPARASRRARHLHGRRRRAAVRRPAPTDRDRPRAASRRALLLLDEATSALDAESERLVQDALDRLMADRTTIVIAHRLATVRAADRIVVMDQGRIVEEGTHASLNARGGLYARLARLQFEDRAA